MKGCLVDWESRSSMPHIFTKCGQVFKGKADLLAKRTSKRRPVQPWSGRLVTPNDETRSKTMDVLDFEDPLVDLRRRIGDQCLDLIIIEDDIAVLRKGEAMRSRLFKGRKNFDHG